MLVDVVIPELGESITEGTITTWHARVGEQVEEDQPLVEIDTDKVSVDVPAPASGVLKELLVEAGADVAVGAVIARIEQGAVAAAGEEKQAAEPPPEPPGEDRPRPRGESAAPRAASAQAQEAVAPAAAPAPEGNGHVLSPAVRRLIEEHHLEAEGIEGTGPHGRLLKEDVLRHLEGAGPEAREAPERPEKREAREAPERPEKREAREAPEGPEKREAREAPEGPEKREAREAPEVPEKREAPGRAVQRVKMTRLRRSIAQRLKDVQNTAAILTTFNEVDMSAVLGARRRLGEAFQKDHGVKLGFMGFFVKAVVDGLKAFPALNGSIEGDEIVYHRYYDLGVAVSTERGLVVPVLRDADGLSFAEIEKGIAGLSSAARDGTLSLDQLTGGTFSITNGGIFGSMLSTPILNPPQSGILGMHNITPRPVAVDDRVEVRPVMYLALSYDHRLVDGAEAVRFLVRVKQALEDPTRMLLEV